MCQRLTWPCGPPLQGVHITLRMRLMCEVWRAGRDDPEQTYEVMNEVVVDRGANPYLTKIECWEHGRLITKVRRRRHLAHGIHRAPHGCRVKATSPASVVACAQFAPCFYIHTALTVATVGTPGVIEHWPMRTIHMTATGRQ